MRWVTFWANFSQTHLVTLQVSVGVQEKEIKKFFTPSLVNFILSH
jgi:hypothetical protein